MPTSATRADSALPSTLRHVIALLRVTSRCGIRGAGIDDYLDGTDLSRPTVYRLLKGLREEGFLRHSPVRHRYLLGYELLALGSEAGNGGNLRELARPHLFSLAQQFGGSFYLFALDGAHAVCLEVQNGAYAVGSFAGTMGGRVPLGAGQASVALLSTLDPDARALVLKQHQACLRAEYHIDISRIEQAVAEVHHAGFTRGVEGASLPEFAGVAVTVADPSGRSPTALSCSMLKSRLSDGREAEVIKALQDAAGQMAQQIHGMLGSVS